MPACEHSRPAPRNRPRQRPVNLEDTRAVAKAPQLRGVGRRQRVAAHAQRLTRRDIEECGARRRQFGERANGPSDLDLAAELAKIRRHRVGDRLRSAAREGPTMRVRRGGEHESDGGGRGGVERLHAMRCDAAEQRGRSAIGETIRERRRGANGARAEAREAKRVRRHVQRRQHIRRDYIPVAREGLDEGAIRRAVAAERAAGRVEVALEERGRCIVERMRERDARMNPLEAEPVERQRRQERRSDAERVHRGADVMHEARFGERLAPRSAAERRFALEHEHREARARDGDRRGQSVRSGSHHDRVVRWHGARCSRGGSRHG